MAGSITGTDKMSEELQTRVRDIEEDVRGIKKSIVAQDEIHIVVLENQKKQDMKQDGFDKKLDGISLQIAEARGFWAMARIAGGVAAATFGAAIASIWAFFKDGP